MPTALVPPPLSGAFRLSCSVEAKIDHDIKAAPGEASQPALPKFSIVGYTGGKMTPMGYYYPVVVSLAGMSIPNQKIPALYNHDTVAGHTTAISASTKQLQFAGVLSGFTADSSDQSDIASAARELLRLAQNGFPWQASIGATVEQSVFIPEGESAKANGQVFEGPFYLISQSTLREISLLALGADGATSANISASISQGKTMNPQFDNWLKAKNIAPEAFTALPEPVQTALKASHEAESKPAPAPTPAPAAPIQAQPNTQHQTVDQIIQAQKQETMRRDKITAMVADHARNCYDPHRLEALQNVGQLAIEANWTLSQTELEMLRLGRPSGPHFHTPTKPDITQDVLIAATCMAGGRLSTLEKDFDEKTLHAASRNFKNGLTLHGLIAHAARSNGWRGEDVRYDLRAAWEYATARTDIRAEVGPSSYSIPGILSNVAHKYLIDAFNFTETSWRDIAAIRSVVDFKAISSYSLSGDMQYQMVPPGGELKHGTLGQTSYTNSASTFGVVFGIDRRDLVNDDLGAFTRLASRMGRGAGLKLNNLFWTTLLNDSTFFPTDKSNSNYDDGATDSVLTLAGLDNAYTIFTTQTDPDGHILGAKPQILLVPSALFATAKNLMSGMITAAAQSTATVTTANVWQGMFNVVQSAYLQDSSILGSSSTAWYLLASPQDIPVIEVCFLNGRQEPTVEMGSLDFDRLGQAMRAYHDFGVALQEYRGGVKLKGAA